VAADDAAGVAGEGAVVEERGEVKEDDGKRSGGDGNILENRAKV